MSFLLLGEVGLLSASIQHRLRRVEVLVDTRTQAPGSLAGARDDRSAQALAARPDPDRPGNATIVVLESSDHDRRQAEVSARIDALWRFCVATRLAAADSDVVHAAGQRYVAVVAPALGEQALRRFRGCLQDSAVDYVQLRVVATSDIGAGSGGTRSDRVSAGE